MTVCQDPWAPGTSEANIDIDALARERVGQYLVPHDRASPNGVAHIVSGVWWGEERASGTTDVELSVHCGQDASPAHYSLSASSSEGLPVCQRCTEKKAAGWQRPRYWPPL